MTGATFETGLSAKGGRDNAFDTIRLLAATAVIFSHAFVQVDGREIAEPLYNLTNGQITIGRGAVAAFFVVSGLLISMSFDRSSSLVRFISNRALRLFPGLWVCLILLIFIFGPIMTPVPISAYATSRETLGFLGSFVFFPFSQSVEGVFDGLPGSDAINGSLWTLKYEVACYAFGALLISTGRFRIFVVALCWLASMVTTRILGDPLEQSGVTYYIAWMVWLFRFYGAGMLLYLLRDRIPLSKWAALASLMVVIASAFTPLFTEILAIFGAYALIASAFLATRWFKDLTGKGDLSYGVYIYAFPVQQALVPFSLETPIPWLTNFLIATPITFALAWLSWHFVERPALGLKARFQPKRAAGLA